MRSQSTREAIPWCILVLLLAAQAALVVSAPPRPLGGDEAYYVQKAERIVARGSLPKATPHDLQVEAGAWGNSDWRPPGYSLLIAAISGGDFDPSSLRRRFAALHFATMAAAIALALSLIREKFAIRVAAAVVLGIAPWPFAFVNTIGPDSLNASIAFFGLFLLIRSCRAPAARWQLFLGSLLLSSTLLLRPEMVAVVPIPIAVCLLVRRRGWLLAGAAFLIVVAAQYGYRTYFIGKLAPSLFGGLHIYNAGAFAWTNSWLGTEDEAYDFVYGLSDRDTTGELPSRAFANERERMVVEELRARVRAHGYSEEVDRAFAELARARVREHPIAAGVLPRLWHAVHLWINLETNDPLLQALRPVPRPLRRGILGALLLLKLLLVLLFAVRAVRGRRIPSTAILASFVITRTLLVGLVLNWMVSRYMVAAWIPLIVVAFTTGPPVPRHLAPDIRE